MAKHKKFLKSEKAKIKLKGAKLPKGLNITKTDFKVKKIIIPEQQFKDVRNEQGVLQKQNIKDILSKFNHHNASHRIEGVRHLKEMLVHFPDDVRNTLSIVVKDLSRLCLDQDKDVRKECFKTLTMLLSIIPSTQIQPFFDLLSSYLLCAMTHIHTNIQEDSLFMLDVFIEYLPSLINMYSDKILSSFLDMISKLRNESQANRTLKLNLNSKMTSVKWRINVLNRLLEMLNVMVLELEKGQSMNTNVVCSSTEDTQNNKGFSLSTEMHKQTNIKNNHYNNSVNYFQNNTVQYFPIVHSQLNEICDLPKLFRKHTTDAKFSVGATITTNNDTKNIQKYANILMPLLFETWQEVKSSSIHNAYQNECALDAEGANTLKIILKIMEQLYRLIVNVDEEFNCNDNRRWFAITFINDYNVQFLQTFPYCRDSATNVDGGNKSKGQKSKLKKSEVVVVGSEKCLEQNFLIIYLFNCLYAEALLQSATNRSNYKSMIMKLTQYLIDRMEKLKSINFSVNDLAHTFIKLLRVIFLKTIDGVKPKESKVHRDVIIELLQSIILSYQHNRFPNDIRTKILLLLCDIALDSRLIHFHENALFKMWLQTLPNLLCQPFISKHVLETLTHLAKQNNQEFLINLESKQAEILENLSSIQILGGSTTHTENQSKLNEDKKQILNLFYWIKNINLETLKNKVNLSMELMVYIKEIHELQKVNSLVQ